MSSTFEHRKSTTKLIIVPNIDNEKTTLKIQLKIMWQWFFYNSTTGEGKFSCFYQTVLYVLVSLTYNISRKLGYHNTDLCRLQIKYLGDFVIQFFNISKAFDFPRWASMSKLAVKYKLRSSRRFFFLRLRPWFWLFCRLMWRSRRNGVRTKMLWSRRNGSLRSCTNLSIAWRSETGWSIIRPFFISHGFTGIRKICSAFLK